MLIHSGDSVNTSSGSGSSSGSNGIPPKPILTFSGGGWGGGDSKDFTLTRGIPVGAQVTASVRAVDGWAIERVAWSGLTGAYSSYFSSPAESLSNATPAYLAKQPFVPSLQQSLPQTMVTFLVDPRKESYDIKAEVTYVGVAQTVSVTGSFTPVKPTTSLIVISNLPADLAIQGGQNGFEYRGVETPYPNDAGIRFEFTTDIPEYPINMNEPPGGWGGSFMIMQTITPARRYSDNLGKNYTMPPDNQVPAPNQQFAGTTYPTTTVNLDNATGPIGAELEKFTNGQTDPYTDAMGNATNHWEQEFVDPPLTLTAADPVSALFLNPNSTVSGSINQETADTYLMYKPDGGVWTALNSIHWSWSVSASAVAMWDPTGRANPSNPVPPADPWPEWAGLISNVLARPNGGWVAV